MARPTRAVDRAKVDPKAANAAAAGPGAAQTVTMERDESFMGHAGAQRGAQK
jgi:hypothetical protein